MDFQIHRLLAQVRPSGTSATTGYTKPSKKTVTITHIVISNTTGSAVTVSLYYDADGSTYDETTSILFGQTIAANDTWIIDIPWTMEVASGTVGVRTGTGSALTFSIFGQVRDIT